MLRCKRCGHIFDVEEREIVYESHPYGEGYAREEWSACPCCSDTDIEEYTGDEE